MISRRVRRLAIIASVLVFLIGFIGWILHVPERPENGFRAIPADASFVWAHPNPAAQWDALLANPVFRGVGAKYGLTADRLDAIRSDRHFKAWVNRLASGQVILFQAPAWQGEPSATYWAATSWLGSRSHLMRWMLQTGRLRGFERVEEYQGRVIWRWRGRSWPSDMAIYLAFEEGLLIACYSNQIADMVRLLAAYDGSIYSFDPGRIGKEYPVFSSGILTDPAAVEFAVREIGETSLSGRVGGETETSWLSPLGRLPMDDFLDARADILLRLSPDFFDRWVMPAWDSPWTEALAPSLAPLLRAPVTVGLFSGNLSGRLYGIRIPTAILSVPVADETDAITRMKSALDTLNAEMQTGVIAAEERVNGYSLYVLEATAGGPYASVAPEERAGFMIRENRLLFSSQAALLRSLANGGIVLSGDPIPEIPNEADAALSLRMDMVRGGQSLRAVIALLTLRAAFAGGMDPAWSGRLRLAREWLQRAEPLGRLDAALFHQRDRLTLDFTTTVPSGEPP